MSNKNSVVPFCFFFFFLTKIEGIRWKNLRKIFLRCTQGVFISLATLFYTKSPLCFARAGIQLPLCFACLKPVQVNKGYVTFFFLSKQCSRRNFFLYVLCSVFFYFWVFLNTTNNTISLSIYCTFLHQNTKYSEKTFFQI